MNSPILSADTKEMLSQFAAWIALLWTVYNAIRVRSHDKELEKFKSGLRGDVDHRLLNEESRLRVSGELGLRLHNESWALLRQINDASFEAFEALRDYQAAVMWAIHTKERKGLDKHASALAAVRKLSGLCHCAPPKAELLRRGSSQFTNVFNAITAMLLEFDNPPPAQAVFAKLVEDGRDALGLVAQGTAKWNQELWAAQEALATKA
ncbi:MAG TPA: hypothetical protein VJV79_04050 [Polyangiaceae bacterium]|nr:hypothetical protein [Polyangiaceae bacterium]